jgi:hypothetical protein
LGTLPIEGMEGPRVDLEPEAASCYCPVFVDILRERERERESARAYRAHTRRRKDEEGVCVSGVRGVCVSGVRKSLSLCLCE